MQPGVTDISLQFNLSNYSLVHQVPQVIPSVFSGEKLVVYGLLKPSMTRKASALPQGKAVLRYTLLGQKLESIVPFAAEAGGVETIPAIHHLAAKQLLKEMEDGIFTPEIAKLSIESGVVCSETAFIAVDEESHLPISGPLKTYDVLMDDLCGFESVFDSANSVRCCLSAAVDCMDDSDEEECEDEMGFLDYNAVGNTAFSDQLASVAFAAPLVVREQVATGPSLSSLVALQQANGSWSLTAALSTQLGKEQRTVEDSCPSGCPSSVWATALALGSLKVTYASQQDEWELVAKKAESWLKNQSLPSNLTLKGILSDAQTFLQPF